ncbi:sensor histidine kinase [Leptospira bandrabouensis]|uniref:sensor histidine kinase n=1 Tax=Leptospira bandrabouensis TaxID=2484903 RepID=UPI001EE8F2F7|nr:HAMP domain-containing sensor histidine kinase [Leptospira bandrabouensis]MCG6145458.1 HAMP domain-containing histidine kinase [Leptospira bandrabouensis]MCG6161082.1 HAMP domain-containing histidine kinase [Leptospira bandrabouensis]MCG6164794.1 HAMP domain-containing histidine kinase [Leptospira bandrabouensis]
MNLDPWSLLKASIEGDDSGTAILSIDRSSKKFEIILKNENFAFLEKEIDLKEFLSQKINNSDYTTELIYKTNGKILETSFGKFQFPEGLKNKEYTKFFIKDITTKQRQEEEIAWRLRFELGVASSIQILIQQHSIREGLPQALYQLLYFTEMDSVFFLKYELEGEKDKFQIWANERKTTKYPLIPKKCENENWYDLGLGRWFHKLKNGKTIYLTPNKALPREKWFLTETKAEILLLIPVLFENKFLGIMGFLKYKKNSPIQHENLLIYQTVSRWMGLFVQRDLDLTELNRYKSSLESLVLERTLALTKTKEELERAYKAKTEFLAHMSHELRTPLNSIIGFSKLIQLPETDETGKEYLNYIYTGGTRLLNMINEILNLMKIESGQIKIQITTFRPEDICRQTLELIQPQANAKKMEIRFRPPIESKPVTSDSGKILQILLNLLSNAIKYTNHPYIELDCEWIDGSLEISVRDFGPGISIDDQNRIFHTFTRLNDDGNIEGTGLGLTISQGLAIRLGGTLELQSQLGQGSVFKLKLPEIIK